MFCVVICWTRGLFWKWWLKWVVTTPALNIQASKLNLNTNIGLSILNPKLMIFTTVHSSEGNKWISNSKQFVDTNKNTRESYFFCFVLFKTGFLYEKAFKNFIFFSKYLVESSEKFQTSTLFSYGFKESTIIMHRVRITDTETLTKALTLVLGEYSRETGTGKTCHLQTHWQQNHLCLTPSHILSNSVLLKEL